MGQLLYIISHHNQKYMNCSRIVRLFQNYVNPFRYTFCNQKVKNQAFSKKQKSSQSLIKAKGLVLNQHILPTLNKVCQITKPMIKNFKNKHANYIVALVQKVLHQAKPQNQIPVAQKFYDVSVYCKIQFVDHSNIKLTGLHKVRVEDIKLNEFQVEEEDAIKIQPIFEQGEKIKQIYFKNRQYQLTVSKIEQPEQQLTAETQIAYRIMVQNFLNFIPFHLGKLQIYSQKNINFTCDYILGVICNPVNDKQAIQNYLQATSQLKKIQIVNQNLIKAINKSQLMNSLIKQVDEHRFQRALQQAYMQNLKLLKMKRAGKKQIQIKIQKWRAIFQSMNPPEQIKKIFNMEIMKYRHTQRSSVQSSIQETYLNTIASIPYNKLSQEKFDIQYAQRVMDQEHYGMKTVKDKILQLIAIGKLKNGLSGKILCLIGGPGIGKTSFAKSIAKALNRNFYSISLGGVTDPSVLKGHRRTYIGAYAGKIIEALIHCKTSNPVILLDQIDKMGVGSHGDPRFELLEILDPNQNSSFLDNFVDFPVDLSKVLFITSANYKARISKPLLDRMEKIELTSYSKEQKTKIFQQHLLKRALESSGLKPQQYQLPLEVIEQIVQQYSIGEPGVRLLQKNAFKIFDKLAYKIVTNEQSTPIKITKQNLHNYLGQPFFILKNHLNLGKGVAISLAQGQNGGRLTYIESFKKSHSNKKQGTLFTGSLGNVLKQAISISYTYAQNFLSEHFQNEFLHENEVHIHASEGAFQKDGSADSLTIVASLVSLALNTKVKSGVAMSGQISLSGLVLRTEGIKQKVIIAKREKIKEVIFPASNQADVQQISKQLTEGIHFYYVKDFKEVFNYLFPQIAINSKQACVSA